MRARRRRRDDGGAAAPRGVPVETPVPYDVDALRLLRLVRIRRALRWTVFVAFLALPGWFAVIVGVQAILPRSAALWDGIDDAANEGFAGIFAVLVLAALGLVGSRFAGLTGRVAAGIVPLFGAGPEPKVESGRGQVRGLLAPLRRKSLVNFGATLIVLLLAVAGAFAAADVPDAWAAAHGRGGLVVTIGEDASISRAERGARSTTYFLDTPFGEVVAEGRPRDGQRWLLSGDDVRRAYRVGGYGYLTVALVAALAWLTAAGYGAYTVAGTRAELRRRAAAGEPPLVDAVRALAGGGRATLRVGARPPVVLGLPPLGRRSAEEVLRRRRRVALGAGAGAAAATFAFAGGALAAAGAFEAPDHRDVTLAYLADASWDPDASVYYLDSPAGRRLLADAMARAGAPGAQVRLSWTVFLTRAASPAGLDPISASAEVFDIGAAPCPAAVDAATALADAGEGSTAVAARLLPPGWRGLVTPSSSPTFGPLVDLAGCADGTLLTLAASGAEPGDDRTEALGELARAIDAAGIGRFRDDTAR